MLLSDELLRILERFRYLLLVRFELIFDQKELILLSLDLLMKVLFGDCHFIEGIPVLADKFFDILECVPIENTFALLYFPSCLRCRAFLIILIIRHTFFGCPLFTELSSCPLALTSFGNIRTATFWRRILGQITSILRLIQFVR